MCLHAGVEPTDPAHIALAVSVKSLRAVGPWGMAQVPDSNL